MRIISGNHKGKKIIEPKDKTTRPLKDITKEALFNVLQHSTIFNFNIVNANILDLFSGVGSFGLECLSRGASRVFFAENYKPAIKILKKNITILNYKERSDIIEKDIFNKNSFDKIKINFDLIFVDLPFKEERLLELFSIINKKKLPKDDGLIIFHRHKNTKDAFDKIIKFIELNYSERNKMGYEGHLYTKKYFNNLIIIKKYLNIIK